MGEQRLVMKRISILIFGCFILVGAGGASDEERMGARGKLCDSDLFYSFSPDNPDHLKRVLLLSQLSQRPDCSFRLVTVSHTVPDRAAQQFQVGRDPVARIPTAISQRLPGAVDYIVLVGPNGHIRAEGDGGSMERVLALSEPYFPLATDVKEDTWGKIKDLFQ
jgi:hypothetical protein